MSKIKTSKKGMFPDDFTELIALAFIFVLAGILIWFYFSGNEQKINTQAQADAEQIDSSQLLLQFLKTPAKSGEVTDLIAQSYHKKDYSELQAIAEKFFASNFKNNDVSSWMVRIIEMPSEDEITSFKGSKETGIGRTMLSSIIIPIEKNEKSVYLRIELFKVKIPEYYAA